MGPMRYLVYRMLAVTVALACGSLAAGGQEATTEPATSAPASQPTTTSAPAGMAGLDEALALTYEESQAVAVATKRPGTLPEPGLYIMLLRAIRAGQVPDLDISRLAWPDVRSLTRYPQHYYQQPIRLRLKVIMVRRMAPGADLATGPTWPQDRPLWRLDCLSAEGEHPKEFPIIVLAVNEPRLSGTPKSLDDGSLFYSNAPTVEVAGIFYKVYNDRDRDGFLRDYPVVLAWQVDKPTGKAAAGPRFTINPAIMALVGVMVVAFVLVRRRAKAARQKEPEAPEYRPLRERLEELDRIEATKTESTQEDSPDAALLKRAAQDYQKEKNMPHEEHRG